MASSISPLGSSAGLATLGLTPSPKQRPETEERPAASAAVETTVQQWRGAREAARSGQAALALSSAAARQAAGLLDEIAAAAREGRGQEMAALNATLQNRVGEAIKAGASLISGQNLRLDLGAEPFVVEGVNLQFGAPPAEALESAGVGDAVASAASQAAAEARALAAEWDKAALRVSAHEGVLAAAAQMGQSTNRDLDADGARLLALQIRQTMADSPLAIANADPKAILALFKS